MKKILFLSGIFLLWAYGLKAQDSIPAYKLYKVEFDFKYLDEANLELLAMINIQPYLSLRQQNVNTEVYDVPSGQVLIIYSEDYLQRIKSPYYNCVNLTNETNGKIH